MAEQAVDRIRRMECCLDILLEAAKDPGKIRSSASLRVLLQSLQEYYTGGLWLQDYTLDEQGCLPRELKRGVLAQDTVYDLLSFLGCETKP